MTASAGGPIYFEWLLASSRIGSPAKYQQIRDFTADGPASEAVRVALAETLNAHLVSPDLVDEIVRSVDSETAKEFFRAAIPELTSIRHGHLAEMLAHENKTYFDELTVPIRKLRYAIGSGSLHGTDVVALTISEQGEISHIRYVESKFRESTYLDMAVVAHKQLLEEMSSTFPVIIPFILQRLFETNDPLYPAFKAMLSKKHADEIEESFELSLCVDAANWDERIIDRLTAESGIMLAPLVITVIRMPEAKKTIAEVFAKIANLNVIEEED
jgi:hypothetical protein